MMNIFHGIIEQAIPWCQFGKGENKFCTEIDQYVRLIKPTTSECEVNGPECHGG